MNAYRGAVLFDLDGTLVDTLPDITSAINEVRASQGMVAVDSEKLKTHFSNGASAMIAFAFKGKSEEECKTLVARLFDVCEERLGDYASVYPGLDDLLQELADKNIAFGVVTNRNRRLAEPLLRHLGISPTRDCLICPEDVHEPKPSPEGILKALQILDVDRDKAVYAGDHLRDIEAARAAGVRSIACGYGYLGKEEDIKAWGANHVIHDVPGLAVVIRQWLSV